MHIQQLLYHAYSLGRESRGGGFGFSVQFHHHHANVYRQTDNDRPIIPAMSQHDAEEDSSLMRNCTLRLMN